MNAELHVTEALSVIDCGYSRVEAAKMVRAQLIGQEFHKQALGWVKKAYMPPSQDQELRAIVAAMVDVFKGWFGMAVKEVLAVEDELRLPKHGIAGRCDIILKLTRDKFWRVLDLKSVAAVQRTTGLQLAIYEYMAGVKYGIRRWEPRAALQFDKQGRRLLPRLVEFKDPMDLEAFFWAQRLKTHLMKGGMGR